MTAEIVEEPFHVALIIGRNQVKGDREVSQWIGGQQRRAVAQMEFVNTEVAEKFSSVHWR
jgi:hypothetical protein